MGIRATLARLFALPHTQLPQQGDYVPAGPPPAAGDASIAGSAIHGYSQPEPASIDLYRRMRGCPTIALARLAAGAPVKSTPWTADHDEDAPDELVGAVQEIIDLHRTEILRHAMTALDYGYAAWRIEWAYRDGLIQPAEIIPQLPEQAKALIDAKRPHELAGAEFDGSPVPRAKVLWLAYDAEATGFYGRPRSENVRGAYTAWNETLSRLGRYTNKTAGVVPMIEYPEGRSRDRTGREVDNFEIAEKVLAGLGSGKGVTMPNSLVAWADEAMRRGIDMTKLKAWSIQFLESASGHGTEYIGVMRYLDSLLMRGWLVPERAATEGQMGTKAEAETHGSIAIEAGQQFAADIVAAVNRHLVAPMLRMNAGAARERAVIIAAAPIDEESMLWLRQLATTVLSSPANLGLLLDMVDIDALLDSSGVPRRDGSDQDTIDDAVDDAIEPEGFGARFHRAIMEAQ